MRGEVQEAGGWGVVGVNIRNRAVERAQATTVNEV